MAKRDYQWSLFGVKLREGERLEEFEIAARLGLSTLLAWDTRLRRWVVVEEYCQPWLRPDVSPDPELHSWGRHRCLEEARQRLTFDDPHVVRAFEVIEARGTVYLVTEFVNGRTLKEDLSEKGPWSEARVRQLLAALSAGVGAVHEKRLVHEDIRPANVLLRANGHPVLVGFGSARIAMETRYLSLPGMEEARGSPLLERTLPEEAGPWSDIHGLGVVAYEALTGRTPANWRHRRPLDRLPGIVEAGNRMVSGGFVTAVTQALALRAHERPQSVGELQSMLAGPETAAARKAAASSDPPGGDRAADVFARWRRISPDTPEELDGLAAGEAVGEYEITGLLERGFCDLTYLARDAQWTRVVVRQYWPVPWVRTEEEGYRRGLRLFLQEARAWAGLEHPHLIRTREVIETRGTAFWVTEYVEGEKLARSLPGHRRTPDGEVWTTARKLLTALSGGLAALHETGWLHLDIRPAHILVRLSGDPVLTGAAAWIHALLSWLQGRGRTQPVWPSLYAPIEQHGRERLGPWTDIYSLSAVMYEMLDGRQPVHASGRRGLDRLPEIDGALNPADEELAQGIMTALAVHRRHRPQSIGAWRAMFDRLDGMDAPGPPESSWVPAKGIDGVGGRTDVGVLRDPFYRGKLRPGDEVWPRRLGGGTYLIQGRVGAGAVAATHMALDTGSLGVVALKEYAPFALPTNPVRAGEHARGGGVRRRTSATPLERFEAAAQELQQLNHPRLSRVLENGETRFGAAYLVTEYVNGESLASALEKSGPWPEASVRALVAALLDGLAEIHAAGWLHRDVKPGNVMLRENEPVLIDFDSACSAAGWGLLGALSMVTPGYAPIEQYGNQGEGGTMDGHLRVGGVGL